MRPRGDIGDTSTKLYECARIPRTLGEEQVELATRRCRNNRARGSPRATDTSGDTHLDGADAPVDHRINRATEGLERAGCQSARARLGTRKPRAVEDANAEAALRSSLRARASRRPGAYDYEIVIVGHGASTPARVPRTCSGCNRSGSASPRRPGCAAASAGS